MPGRLIDAHELQNLFNDVSTGLLQKQGLQKDVEHMVRAFIMTAQMIKDAPTVDAAPVRHGMWVPVPSSDMATGKAYKCSECKKMRYGSFKPNYCSNCGAKMDGERRTDG